MSAQRIALIVGSTALAYFLLFQLNTLLFSSFGYSQGVSWIFLPSGLRLAFILLFGVWGAIGIALASMLTGYLDQLGGNLVTIIGAGAISGFAPWLAGLICIDMLRLDVDLDNLNGLTLLKVALLFAVVSPVLHQLWFTLRGQTANFAASAGVMFVGDLLGTLLVLYAARLLLNLLPSGEGGVK